MTTHTKTDARFAHGSPDPDAPAAPDDPGRARARRGDRKTLTETVIGRLRAAPLGRRVSHLDSVVPGLVLRVTDRGVKTWYVVTKFRGETLHYRIGAWPGIGLATQKNADGTETMGARDLARDALSKIASGVDPRKHRAKPGRAFGVIAAEFLLSPGEGGAAGKPSEYETTRIVNVELVPQWKNVPLDEIRRADVADLLRPIAERAPTMANRVLGVVSRIFSYAIDQGVVEANPCFRMRKQGEETKRERVYTDDEIRSLWRVFTSCGFPFGHASRLLLLMGQRRGEVTGMKWGDIDHERKLWHATIKGGSRHIVPLLRMALEIVADVPRFDGQDLLFSTTGETPVSGFSKFADHVRAKSGVTDFRLHDLRRTVRTRLSEIGVEADLAERVIGHVLPGMRRIYDRHEYLAEKRDALRAWERRLQQILAAKKPRRRRRSTP